MKHSVWAACLLILATGAAAQDGPGFDDRWYVGVAGGGARLGSDRETNTFAPYLGAYFGRFFGPDFSLDVQIDTYSTEFERDDIALPAGAGDDFDIYGYGLAGRYYFGEAFDDNRLFAMAGVGIQEHDNVFDRGRDAYFSAGFGFLSRVGDHLSVRGQFEGRYDNERDTLDRDNGFFDMIASVGLSWSFGAPPRAPRPSPAPAPARPAPPAPAPQPAPQPAPAPAPAAPEVLFEFDTRVFFAFDSAALRDSARRELDAAAGVLGERDETILIEVAGHTDSIGTEAYNQRLSERRAQAVADYLVGRGIARGRLEVRGYGETRPAVANDSPENRQRNRRVVLSVLDRR